MSTGNGFVFKEKKFLISQISCYVIALLATWTLPWTTLNAPSYVMIMFDRSSYHRIHNLDVLASDLADSGESIKWIYIIGFFLILLALGVTAVYSFIAFSKDYPWVGTLVTASLVCAAIFVELYRFVLNMKLAVTDLPVDYSISTSGVSVLVIVLALLGRFLGYKHTSMLPINIYASEGETRYCSVCNYILKPHAKYCSHCGAPVTETAVAKRSAGDSNIGKVIGVCLLIVLALLALSLILGNEGVTCARCGEKVSEYVDVYGETYCEDCWYNG